MIYPRSVQSFFARPIHLAPKVLDNYPCIHLPNPTSGHDRQVLAVAWCRPHQNEVSPGAAKNLFLVLFSAAALDLVGRARMCLFTVRARVSQNREPGQQSLLFLLLISSSSSSGSWQNGIVH